MGKESFKILTLNNISVRGLDRLPRERYEVASEIGHPDAILLRSADMHEMDVPASVRAVARAGAGTNNIPVARLSKPIPVAESSTFTMRHCVSDTETSATSAASVP